jgi:TonB-dependent SusC/RagA subfamily outer membrane receptor
MLSKIRFPLFFFLGLCLTFATEGQERMIHGVVTTFDSIPLMDVEIRVKSSGQTVYSDSLGRFMAPTEPEEKLILKAHGFQTQRVKLNEKIKFAAINLKLKPGEQNREYATGYGHVSDRDKLSALDNLNRDDLDFSQYDNIYDMIKGRFAGVDVKNGEIIIRGISSFNLSSSALIVVDGIPTTDASILQTIPPSQVSNINVIKDGSAAIYGVRGANGVVIIETRRGND